MKKPQSLQNKLLNACSADAQPDAHNQNLDTSQPSEKELMVIPKATALKTGMMAATRFRLALVLHACVHILQKHKHMMHLIVLQEPISAVAAKEAPRFFQRANQNQCFRSNNNFFSAIAAYRSS